VLQEILCWLVAINPRTLTTIGLLLDIAGAYMLARALIVSVDEARRLSAAYFGGSKPGSAGPLTPPMRDRLTQARNARMGLPLLVAGFVLQILAAWWPLPLFFVSPATCVA
jgi:hypothetical protein